MPKKSYRYYHLNGDGHLDAADWFAAANDKDAMAQIVAKHPNARTEIWDGTRLVAKMYPMRFDADDPLIQKEVGERLSALAHRRGRAGRVHVLNMIDGLMDVLGPQHDLGFA